MQESIAERAPYSEVPFLLYSTNQIMIVILCVTHHISTSPSRGLSHACHIKCQNNDCSVARFSSGVQPGKCLYLSLGIEILRQGMALFVANTHTSIIF